MVTVKHFDGAATSAIALGEVRRTATRMTASIRDTALVVMALLWQSKASMVSSAVKLSVSTDSTKPRGRLESIAVPSRQRLHPSPSKTPRGSQQNRPPRLPPTHADPNPVDIAWPGAAASAADDAGPPPSAGKRELNIATK
jgi:hypothetical protein